MAVLPITREEDEEEEELQQNTRRVEVTVRRH